MKEMYPKNPDGMCSGPVYCKTADVKTNDLEALFSEAFLLNCVQWIVLDGCFLIVKYLF